MESFDLLAAAMEYPQLPAEEDEPAKRLYLQAEERFQRISTLLRGKRQDLLWKLADEFKQRYVDSHTTLTANDMQDISTHFQQHRDIISKPFVDKAETLCWCNEALAWLKQHAEPDQWEGWSDQTLELVQSAANRADELDASEEVRDWLSRLAGEWAVRLRTTRRALEKLKAWCAESDKARNGATAVTELETHDHFENPSLAVEVSPCCFQRDGRVWTVRFQGKTASIPDLKGCSPLAQLLAAPRRAISANVLEGGIEGLTEPQSNQEMMDTPSLTQAREVVRKLEARAETAEATGNGEEHRRLQKEIDKIRDEIRRTHDGKGRKRNLGGLPPDEKAAKRVEQNIKNVRKALEIDLPDFTAHLKHVQKNGASLIYNPIDPVPDWKIQL